MGSLLIAAAAATAGWAIWDAAFVVHEPRDPPAARGDWETASLGDCPLMAQALNVDRAGKAPEVLPLMGADSRAGPCDWSRWGLRLGRVTEAEFQAAAKAAHGVGYIPHLSLGRPRYSRLRLRAEVSVGRLYGWEAGSGEICRFQRDFTGWRLQQCRASWIS